MRKRVLVGGLLVSALLIPLAACSGGGDSADGDSVKVMVVQNTNQIPISKMAWAKSLAKSIGCTVNWQTIDDTAWGQQKNPSLAAGDVPDVAIRAINANDAAQYPGLFADMSKHMKSLPNVKAFFAQQSAAEKLSETTKGEIFTLASSRGKGYSGSGQHMMINKAWLDKLGLPIPKTWDELTSTLEAFKNDDPNGNGKADEIPFNIRALGTDGFGWYSPMLLLNSTGIVTQFNKGPSAQGIYVQNGKVANFLVSDQYKSVLEYYHQLMSDGLIPADALTKADSAYYADQSTDGKTAKTGLIFGWSLQDFGDLQDQYVAMPAPAAPGVSASKVVWDGSDNEFETGKLSVSEKAKDNPCVWKFVNAMYSKKYSVQQFSGSFGEYLTDKGDDTYAVTDAYLKAGADGKYPALTDRLAGWIPNDVTITGDVGPGDLRKVDDVYKEQYANYSHTKDMMPDWARLTADEATTVANNDTAIMNYAMQQTSKWMMNGGIDQGWDDYVAKLKSVGIDQNTKIWQTAYNRATK